MKSAIKVIIIDDDTYSRKHVIQMISADADFQLIDALPSGTDGLERIKLLKPELVLLDLNTENINGLEFLEQIKQLELKVCCVVLTASDTKDDVVQALRVGANGYLLKDITHEALCLNLKKALGGLTVLHDRVQKILISAIIDRKEPAKEKNLSLSNREMEILNCLTNQLNNKTIANNFGISVSTVKTHIKHLLTKLNLDSREAAIAWANKSSIQLAYMY